MKRKNPVRCSQVVYPYGVGSMVIVKGGGAFLVAGLDGWYRSEEGGEASGQVDESEFIITEPRLQELLKVDHFRSPPAYREPRRGLQVPNVNLTIPVVRFPQWHVCIRCDRMEFLPLTQKDKKYCCFCREEGITVELSQIPFIALCEKGHLQDFPWREWAHREHNPTCPGQLSYLRSGGGTIAGQKIKCSCGTVRSLANIDKAGFSDTFLSFNLSRKDGLFLCQGHRPWLAETVNTKCDGYLRGNLRGAANVWFAQTASAILLPRNWETGKSQLKDFLSRPELIAQIKSLKEFGNINLIRTFRIFHSAFLADFEDGEIEETVKAVSADATGGDHGGENSTAFKKKQTAILDRGTPARGKDDAEFRYPEYQILREDQDEEELITSRVKLPPNASLLSKNFSRVVLVRRLRETRVFTGFSRIFSDNLLSLEDRKKMLRRTPPAVAVVAGEELSESEVNNRHDDWLPATIVFGEGIFLEFHEKRLREWENRFRQSLKKHFAPLEAAFNRTRREGSRSREELSPRFILIHTLAHLLVAQLALASGYSAAALRERLYVSEDESTPMAGLLIYTAEGDSKGTLGGLVEMGNPQILERILLRALEKAKWCAYDPVCSEIGTTQGQGPDSCNLAACQACALLAETTCEEFNRFLDRALLVDIAGSQIGGYFEGSLK